MNVNSKRMNESSIADEIIMYVDRLTSSLYLEDRNNALENLYRLSEESIFLVAIHSMDQIISSMLKADDINLQKSILLKIFNSEYKNEFVDIFLKREENLCIIISWLDDLHKLIAIFSKKNGRRVYEILFRNNILYKIINRLDVSLYFLKNLIYSENKRIFVIEGLIENILEIVDRSNRKNCIEILASLLKDNVSNQNYFLELRWIEKFSNKPIDIFCSLLDKKNNKFKILQEFFCKEEFLDLKRYDFISRLIYENPKNLLKIENLGFCVEDILKEDLIDSRAKKDILNLVEYINYIKAIDFDTINESSNIYMYVITIIILGKIEDDNYFRITLKEFHDDVIFNICNLKEMEREKFIGLIIFLIAIYDIHKLDNNSLMIINSIFNDFTVPLIERSFCSLLISKYFDRTNIFEMNTKYIESYLRKLAKIIYNEEILISEIIMDFLIYNINKFISNNCKNLNQRSEYLELLHIELKEKQRISKEIDSTEKEIKVNFIDEKTGSKENLNNLKDEEHINANNLEIDSSKNGRISKITSIFSKFRIKNKSPEKKEEDVYDL